MFVYEKVGGWEKGRYLARRLQRANLIATLHESDNQASRSQYSNDSIDSINYLMSRQK
jgi:hypothetical protein